MAAVEITWNFFLRYMERCFPIDHDTNTDAQTTLMLTKCVNTLTGNVSKFHKQIPINPKRDIKA